MKRFVVLLLLGCTSAFGGVNSVYEIIPYRYVPKGSGLSPLAYIASDLKRIQSLGFDTVRLLPITPVYRDPVWPSIYLVMDQRAIEPEAGTAQELKDLVRKAHALNLKVVLEWIGHNVSKASPLRALHPEFFHSDGQGNHIVNVWQGVSFNFNRADVQNYLLDSMLYWLNEFDIDGYRCDVAPFVPQSFWRRASKELRRVKRDFFMLAEVNNDPVAAWGQVDPFPNPWDHDPTGPLVRNGFNAVTDRSTYMILADIADGKKDAEDLWRETLRQISSYPAEAESMHFTSCHDFDVSASSVTRLGAANRTMAALIHFLPGNTLTFNGQEFGNRHPMTHIISGDRIWDFPGDRETGTESFYIQLMKLKAEFRLGPHISDSPITRVDTAREVFAFIRENQGKKLFAIFNLSNQTQRVKLSPGAVSGVYHDGFNGDVVVVEGGRTQTLPPWGYRLLVSSIR